MRRDFCPTLIPILSNLIKKKKKQFLAKENPFTILVEEQNSGKRRQDDSMKTSIMKILKENCQMMEIKTQSLTR